MSPNLFGQVPFTCSADRTHHFQHIITSVESSRNDALPKLFYQQHPNLDSFCFKSFVQYLNLSSFDYSNKCLSVLIILREHYGQSYDSLEDTLILRVISNKLRYNVELTGWAMIDEKRDTCQFLPGFIGRILLKKGKKAIPFLSDLLQDIHRVSYGGSASESQLIYGIYQLRRKDLAYFYLATILGERPIVKKSPQERDLIIQQFMEKYPKELSQK